MIHTKSKNTRLTLCNKSEDLPDDHIPLPDYAVSFTVHDAIESIDDLWDATIGQEQFARSPYLKTIERDSPSTLKNLYVLYHSKDGKVIGALLLQHLLLDFSESFQYENYSTDRSLYSTWLQKIRQKLISLLKFRMMTVGNLYLTGHYGFRFLSDRLEQQEIFQIINKTLKILSKELCNTPFRFGGVLYKDFFEDQKPPDSKKLGMSEFFFDPNMILHINPNWQSFDDYLLDMRSKYRIRLKSAIRKFGDIEKREMTLAEIKINNDAIYKLYNSILDGSGFVLAKGEKEYFLSLKEELGDDFHLIGYFKGEKLIGFYTWVLDEGKMDSHFIGFDLSLNHKHQLYLNILLDLVRDAIDQKATSLYYFRTALEIKSSVGAIPKEMSCYFRHNNFILNRYIIPPIFRSFVPKQKWEQRHPFKTLPSAG